MIDQSPVLAIETSQSNCGACVYFDDIKFFEMNINVKNLHAEKVFEIIDSIIKSSGITVKDLGVIAVSSGPGSFTGLRIGMSAAKGLAFGARLPIVPVPSFDAMAFQLSHFLEDETEFSLANKVNADEMYFAKFKIKSNNYIFVQNLRIVKTSDQFIFGENDLIFGNVSIDFDKKCTFKSFSSPKPEYVAKWARHFGKDRLTYDFDFLEPDYLKNFTIKDKKI
jgi:tRNA threonylcarbamoyladenosine biosynthesis protein TsaB